MNEIIKKEDFEEIFKSTYSNILRFIVINCYHFDDINDIVQDTYLEFLNILNRKKVLKIDNINSFICGISKNIIKRHYKNKKNLVLVHNESEEEIQDDTMLEDDFITKENIDKIWNYIKKEDLQTAKIFYLYYVEDMKIKDIAVELELTESNVKNKLYRGLANLKKNFGKEEF